VIRYPWEYDDGTSDVPPGASDPVERVIVIGAGVAGLVVANALANAGVDCVVLEARDRAGGRLHTMDLGVGGWIDVGGSWIHNVESNPLRRFADQVGVRCRDGDVFADVVAFDPVDSRRLTDEEFLELLELFAGFVATVDELVDQLGDHATASAGVDAYVAGLDLSPATARMARGLIRAGCEAEAASTTENTSLRWLFGGSGGDGRSPFGDLPDGGYRTLIAALAIGVPLRTGAVVTAVEHDSEGVLVRTSDGAVERGSHVVVTLPLGVLKQGSVTFSPPLPAERVGAISRLGFDRFEKVVMTFSEPFWKDAGLNNVVLLPADTSETGAVIFSASERPVLTCLVYDPNVEHVHDRPPQEAAAWLLDKLSAVVGGACPEPVDIVVTDWAGDPFSRGSFTHVPPGSSAEDITLLGEPVSPRVLFAGEATIWDGLGHAGGAAISGIREAKRLLQTETVVLGPVVYRTS
jgi:monoamine oxidase